MKKLKNSIVLLLCAGLLVLGAVVPYLAAWATDHMEGGAPMYAQMESLQLNLEEKQRTLTLTEKLGLMLDGASLQVTEDETRLMVSDLYALVPELLAPYQAWGLLPEPDNDYLQANSVLLYDAEDPAYHAVIWYVYLSVDSVSGDALTLAIDDETGLLLTVDYIHYEEFTPQKKLSALLDEMCQGYLDMHGLVPEEILYGETATVVPTAPALWCRIPTDKGIFTIEMWVHTRGFTIRPVILD